MERAGPEWAGPEWAAEVRRLAAQRDAVILAHNYQAPGIQDVADHVGDSLALSRLAAASTASVIVFAGVYFMAETAKILAPDRTVLIPEPRAGCSLADTITAQQVRDWKAEHPGAAVVAYVNTSAEVKAESDLCCTSANAAQVVASIPENREVLFLPDQFLGAYVQRVTGRAGMHIWLGECHVHAGISPDRLRRKAAAEPEAELFIHPECGCSTAALWQAGEGDLPAGRTRVLFDRGHARGRARHHGARRARGHRDRHAAPAAPGQPGGALGAGQPGCGVPVHEDDDTGRPAALPAGRRARGDRRARRGQPGPPGGAGHDHGRGPASRGPASRGPASRGPAAPRQPGARPPGRARAGRQPRGQRSDRCGAAPPAPFADSLGTRR